MKRIIAVIGLALVISAVSATSALACVVSQFGVWAPNNHPNPGHAPPRHQIVCIPANQGTATAFETSPAIANCIPD